MLNKNFWFRISPFHNPHTITPDPTHPITKTPEKHHHHSLCNTFILTRKSKRKSFLGKNTVCLGDHMSLVVKAQQIKKQG